MDEDSVLNAIDARRLREAIRLSADARRAGNMPYGALLVSATNEVLLGAGNTQVTGRDCTGHAETNLMREASRLIDRETLAGSTVYASGEPCPMCAGAIYWSGVRRVVYALSIATMRELGGALADELALACREVMARGARTVEVVGPALQSEARQIFED